MEVARTVSGELSGCPRCGGQPLLVTARGSNLSHCECPRCRVRLWDRASETDAIQDWERLPRDESAQATTSETTNTQPRAAA